MWGPSLSSPSLRFVPMAKGKKPIGRPIDFGPRYSNEASCTFRPRSFAVRCFYAFAYFAFGLTWPKRIEHWKRLKGIFNLSVTISMASTKAEMASPVSQPPKAS